jgi:hypothetical protein
MYYKMNETASYDIKFTGDKDGAVSLLDICHTFLPIPNGYNNILGSLFEQIEIAGK